MLVLIIHLTVVEAAVTICIIDSSEKNNTRLAFDLKSNFLFPDAISDSIHKAHHENTVCIIMTTK